MARILNNNLDSEIATNVIEQMEDLGYQPEEIIPGLVQAIVLVAEKTFDPEQALDEASNLLASSGVE
jgi:hypothetical protein